MDKLEVRLLGGFAVAVDGVRLAADAFGQRRGADLVKVLALAPGHRLARDVLVETLWPHLTATAGVANLHKAAHHARRALGAQEAIVLQRGIVELAPGAVVDTDVERFENGDAAAYAGELLPDDRYEPWTTDARERLRHHWLTLLRRDRRWQELVAEDPADEEAHRELMREHAAQGDRAAVARQFRLLSEALAGLGLRPSHETLALRDELGRGPAVQTAADIREAMVGRAHELAVASGALAGAADGTGGAVLVVGDAGVGKTRFVDALLAQAAERGFHTLRATAREVEGRTPYRPLAEALEPLLAQRPDLAAGLSDANRDVLGLLVPGAVPGTARGARGQEVLAAIGGLLAAAARERPLVLAVEDLQSADDATLRVLHYLVAAARGSHLLVIGSARPDEGGEPLVALRRALLETPAAREVQLGPLEPDAMRELIRSAAPLALADAAVEAVVGTAAGNPFFGRELALAADRGGELRLPDRLEAVLDARLERLEEVAPDVIEVLAVLDDGCTAQEIAQLAGLKPAVADAQLRAGLRTGALERSGPGWRYRHLLLREAARGRQAPERLAAAHRAVAAHLQAGGAAPERIAAHLLAGGREPEAVPLLRAAAARAAGLGAFADGVRWIELALRHAAPADRGELLELLGDLRHGAGDPRAPAAYAQARAAAPADEAPRLGLKEARAQLALGDLEAAHATAEATTAGHADGRAALVVKGMIAWYRGEYPAARAFAEAAAAADSSAGEDVDDQLYDLQAMVAHAEGRWERAMEAQLDEVWHVPELAGRVLDAYLCVTEYVLNAGNPTETMMRFARQLHDHAEQAGARRGVAFAATVLGEAHLLAGEAEHAREQLARAARLSRAVGTTGGESLARVRLAEALLLLGRPLEARAQLEDALALAHASTLADHLLFLAHGPLVRSAVDPGEALELVDRAEALLDQNPSCRFCPVEYYVPASIACARAGELERGAGLLARAEGSASLWAGGPRWAAVAEARGELLRAQGREADAHVAFLRAVDGYAAAGHRAHERRVRELLTEPARAAGPRSRPRPAS